MTDDLRTRIIAGDESPIDHLAVRKPRMMTDGNQDLRTRIAAVLKEAKIVSYWREGIDQEDGQPYRSLVIRSDDQAAEYAADAVIRELALTQQYLVDGIISDGEPRPWELPCETRYVTEWERFDG